MKELCRCMCHEGFGGAHPGEKCTCNGGPVNEWTEPSTMAKNAETGCPCLLAEVPCHPNCSCANNFSSVGCYACCSHGSLEQRSAHAKTLLSMPAEVAQLRDVLKQITEERTEVISHCVKRDREKTLAVIDRVIAPLQKHADKWGFQEACVSCCVLEELVNLRIEIVTSWEEGDE